MGGSRLKKVGSQLAVAVAGGLVAVTLTGGGPAGAFNVPNNSVTSAKIVNNSIQSIDIKDGAVGVGDLAPAIRPMWAIVRQGLADPELIRGRGAVSVFRNGTVAQPYFTVFFNRPVNRCGWSATFNDIVSGFLSYARTIAVSPFPGNVEPNALRVFIHDPAAPNAPVPLASGTGFTLIVHC